MNPLYKKIPAIGIAITAVWAGFGSLPVTAQAINATHANKATSVLIPFDKAVRTGKLPNGLTYYIRHNEEPKNRVVFYLANKVGSILEDDDQQGLAHFLEHMNFNGTKHFPKSELVNYLQKNGVRFGADLNAYTSFDETVYQLPLPSDDPAVLAKGIQIMRDWAQEATLDPVEIDKERGVVLEEERLGKGADERMERKYWPMLLNNSRYANRIPIGKDEVLNNFKPQTIRRFYQDWYRPDLQALIVVGDIDVNQMEVSIRQKFSDLKSPLHERSRTAYNVKLNGKNHFMALTDKEMTSTVAQVIVKLPGTGLKTTADYRQAITRQLFNIIIDERLNDRKHQPEPPFINASIGAGELLGGVDQLSVQVEANPGQLEKGFKAVWQEVYRVKSLGFTQTEFERAKQSYLSKMEATLKERNKVNSDSYVNEYLQYFLKGIASPGIEYEYALIKKDLPGIDLQELNQLANIMIKATDRDILIQAPKSSRSSLPNESKVIEWMHTVEQEKQSQYVDRVSDKPLLSSLPQGGSILSSQTDNALNITTIELANHIKVVLKPTVFKDNQILFNGFAPGGTSVYNDGDYQSAANATAIVSSFGAGNYSAVELAKFMADKQFAVKMFMGERTQGVSGSATPADLENALKLLYAYYTQPRKDRDLFNGLISRAKAGLVNRANSPGGVFQDTVNAVLGNHNIRRTGPSLKKIEQIDLDKAFDIYRQSFGNAGGTTFTFVGSFDVKTIQQLLVKYLGSLPALDKPADAKDLGIHIPEGKQEVRVNKGSEPKSTVMLVWSGEFDYNQANLFAMDAMKEALEIRLLERLREEESGVYSPTVSLNIAKLPQSRFSLIVNFGCAPQNTDKLIASALDEVDKLTKNGPNQVNIDKWRAELNRSNETEMQTNTWWLAYINGQQQNSEALNQLDTFPALINAVSVDDVKNMAAKNINGKNLIRLILLPEALPF
ncbi:M16 family metallopeptidase [Mucilaginibacter sp.]|uniref:M16 family metallopeptidase n=1 Tax=Mucilaginibacter sp. TaxID=1882438 RepID=UPI002ED3CF58